MARKLKKQNFGAGVYLIDMVRFLVYL